MKKIIRFFKRLFQDRNEQKVLYAFRGYFEGIYLNSECYSEKAGGVETPSLYRMEIHKIKVHTQRSSVRITVFLSRPGIFIGKKGSTIEGFQEYLKKKLNKNVQIKIKEYDPLCLV